MAIVRKTVAGAATTPVYSATFGQAGSAATGASAPFRVPLAGTATRVSLSCTGAPVGSGLVVDFKVNGTTFSTQTIAAGSTTTVTAVTTQALAAGDAITVNATSVGSTTAAVNVSAQVDYTIT
jgi:hypothetical protein